MSFFIRPNKRISSKNPKSFSGKRKAQEKSKLGNRKRHKEEENKPNIRNADLDEEIPSDSEDSAVEGHAPDVQSSSEDEETVQEKRLRLAKKYLEEIEKQETERAESKAIDQDAIAHRLKEDVLEQMGKLQRKVADLYEQADIGLSKILKGHKLSPTCLVISPDDKFVYSSAKDCSIIKWCCKTGKRLKIIPGVRKGDTKTKGHSGHVLCMAISTDYKFLASGCRNKLIHIWDPDKMELIHTFKGHRDVVSGLAFRKGTHQLFSASHDRSVKVWNLDEMAYVETLFGHQDAISSIDALSRERAITSGGRDNTIRIWKIVEESQMVFNGHVGSIDCVRLINEEHFFSCGDDGLLAIWGVLKKKPLVSIPAAHGTCPTNGLSNWITSIVSLQNTDLVASGSCDGHIRFWKCGPGFRSLQPLFSIPICGFVNDLQFSSDGSFLVAVIGQEHRLGRWTCIKEAKNTVCIIPMKKV